MGRGIASIACVISVLALAASAIDAAASTAFGPGDVATYHIDVGFHVHVAPEPRSSQSPVTLDSAADGTETITALRADPDGSIHTRVSVSLRSGSASGAQAVQRTLEMKVSPDGSVTAEGGQSADILQYVNAVGEASKLYRGRTLYVGERFSQTQTIPGALPLTVNTQAVVTGERSYRGYPTFSIQSTGTGKIDTIVEGSRATGTFDLAGTTYVDRRDKLLIGQAMRSTVDASTQGNHVTAVATVALQLESYVHRPARTPAPARTPTPAPPPASPTPAPTPTTGYYTPTPPAPTPSPVYNPYPPPPSALP